MQISRFQFAKKPRKRGTGGEDGGKNRAYRKKCGEMGRLVVAVSVPAQAPAEPVRGLRGIGHLRAPAPGEHKHLQGLRGVRLRIRSTCKGICEHQRVSARSAWRILWRPARTDVLQETQAASAMRVDSWLAEGLPGMNQGRTRWTRGSQRLAERAQRCDGIRAVCQPDSSAPRSDRAESVCCSHECMLNAWSQTA